jgi:hypothetical protein
VQVLTPDGGRRDLTEWDLYYATAASAVAPSAPRITTNQGGARQNTRNKKARTPTPKSAGEKIALVQTGV